MTYIQCLLVIKVNFMILVTLFNHIVCVPCPVGTTCCGKLLGICVCFKPKIDNCCTRLIDPVCYAKKEACQLALKALEKIPG